MAIKNYMINDKWLDIAKQNIVEVESTDGVIGSVKLNGEEYGGGGGGSSDFTTAQVTLIIGSNADASVEGACILEDGGVEYLDTAYPVAANTTSVIPAVLYKGEGTVMIQTSATITVDGDIQQMAPNAYIITGDGTITLS